MWPKCVPGNVFPAVLACIFRLFFDMFSREAPFAELVENRKTNTETRKPISRMIHGHRTLFDVLEELSFLATTIQDNAIIREDLPIMPST